MKNVPDPSIFFTYMNCYGVLLLRQGTHVRTFEFYDLIYDNILLSIYNITIVLR